MALAQRGGFAHVCLCLLDASTTCKSQIPPDVDLYDDTTDRSIITFSFLLSILSCRSSRKELTNLQKELTNLHMTQVTHTLSILQRGCAKLASLEDQSSQPRLLELTALIPRPLNLALQNASPGFKEDGPRSLRLNGWLALLPRPRSTPASEEEVGCSVAGAATVGGPRTGDRPSQIWRRRSAAICG